MLIQICSNVNNKSADSKMHHITVFVSLNGSLECMISLQKDGFRPFGIRVAHQVEGHTEQIGFLCSDFLSVLTETVADYNIPS